MEIPGEGFVVAVDLESFQGFVSPGIAGGFEDGGGAVFEAGEEGRRRRSIVTGCFLRSPGGRVP